jgi:5-methylcytosine-specific restriction endonuclease McrA
VGKPRNNPYKKWYASTAWQNRRKHQLQIEPLCRYCTHKGKLSQARVVDHVVPHCGDYNLFLLGEVQSLCFDCHDKRKRLIDLHGYCSDVNEQGWPIDPAHPTNVRARASRA